MVFSLFCKMYFWNIFFQASQGVVQIYCYYKSKFPYTTGIQVKKNLCPSLLWKKVRFSYGFFVVLQNVFLKHIFFRPSQGVVKIYCYYKSEFYYTNGIHVKKIFWRSLLRKKLKFSNGFFVLLQNVFLKNIFFKLVKELLKSFVTTNQNSPISMRSKSKIIFDLACLGKNWEFQTVFSLFCEMFF